MNPDLSRLQPYPFEKLADLKSGIKPDTSLAHIALSIGEPKYPTPDFILGAVTENLQRLDSYPATRGTDGLRQAIASWLTRRFDLPEDSLGAARHVLPVNGTREALFAFAQCVIDRSAQPVVALPNPGYQIYEGAALLAGAEPWYIPAGKATGYLPDFEAVPEHIWQRCQLLYVCSPGNPTGAVLSEADYARLLELADRFDFVIASDECYSEIYPEGETPPPGLLGAAARLGRTDYRRCMVFHSLSKRSNAPGLRSGFVAGDAELMRAFLHYRTYHGCAMSLPVQAASALAWADEHHVVENRRRYRAAFDAVVDILAPVLPVQRPRAGFYLWPETPVEDTVFCRDLYATQNVTALPGRFMSRACDGADPGRNHVRMALVAPLDECKEAAERIRAYLMEL